MGIKGKAVLELAAGINDDQLNPLASGTVYFYEAGTFTLKDIYLDRDKTTVAANPVTLDIYGRAEVFGDGLYKIVVYNADNVMVWDMDNVEIIPLDGGELNNVNIGLTTPGKGKFTELSFTQKLTDTVGNEIEDYHDLRAFVDSINKDSGEVFKTIEASFNTWVTGTAYAKNDKVKVLVDVDLGVYKVYTANAAHTAGATFAGDSTKWDQDTENSSPYINDPVYFDTVTNKWKLADLLTGNTPEAIINSLVNTSLTVRTALVCFKGLTTTTGVVAGSKYYLQANGGLGTTPTAWYICKGISSTKLLIEIRYITPASSTGNAQAINMLEQMIRIEKNTRLITEDSQVGVIKESFIDPVTGRLVLDSTLAHSQSNANCSLNTSQVEGYCYDTIIVNRKLVLEKLTGSIGQNTNTVFDVSTGNSTTQTTLTGTGIDRHTEFKSGDIVRFVPMRRLKATTTDTKWIQAGQGFRVALTGDGSGSNDITLNHEALTAQLPAYDDDQLKYLCFPEHVSAAYKKEATNSTALTAYTKAAPGGYNIIVPNKVIVKDYGIPYHSYLFSHWKCKEPSGDLIDTLHPAGTYNFSQVGTVPSTTGKIANSKARGPMSAANRFQWTTNTTTYGLQVFAVGFWFKLTALGSYATIMGQQPSAQNSGWSFQVRTDNKLNSVYNGNVLPGSTTLSAGVWYHAYFAQLLASGANNRRIYLNAAIDMQTTGGAISYDATTPCIGNLSGGTETDGIILSEGTFWNTMPSTWAEFERLIALEYSAGVGRSYGSNYGQTFNYSVENISSSIDDRYSIASGIVRNFGLANNVSLEHYAWSF